MQAKVADQSGLDLGMVTKLLPILAPLVMGYLGKKARSGGGIEASALAGALRKEADGLDLGDFTDLLGGDSDGLVEGILGKVKDAITGDQ